MKRGATSGIHHKKRQVEASTSSQKLVKALDYYVVIVTGWKHHYYTGWPVYFVVWHVVARRWCRFAPRIARVRAGLPRYMHFMYEIPVFNLTITVHIIT